ncbi:MAG: AAA family ATPase [Chloroflexi bacterium]|nr:AAA family ATPase [Chloroflexota bacterium]
MARPTIICALPRDEAAAVAHELAIAGLTVHSAELPVEVEEILDNGADVGLAIVDGESDIDRSVEIQRLLHEGKRNIPSLMVISPRSFERLERGEAAGGDDVEYFTRPFSAESLRWRVEAMLIRAQTVDDGSGQVLQNGPIETGDWGRRATVVTIFNPKGGVGKTTVALNLAATLQVTRNLRVMLVDADTVTGHIATSLGLDRVQSVADTWEEEPEELDGAGLGSMAAAHENGLRVVVLASSPLQREDIAPERLGAALAASRVGFDVIVVDLHPDYGALNKAIFERSDRILVPVTPDVPAIRAAVQFVELSHELGFPEKLALVVNRVNSGVSVADMESTIGRKAIGKIRSGGFLFVRAANEGLTVVEKFPKEKVTADFEDLADRLLDRPTPVPSQEKGVFRMFSRPRETVGAR